jgi:stalled ribosome alternative rescue factor ArfA
MRFTQMNRDTQYLIGTLLYTLDARINDDKFAYTLQNVTESILVTYAFLGKTKTHKLDDEVVHALMESELGKHCIDQTMKSNGSHKREARGQVARTFESFWKVNREHMIGDMTTNKQGSLEKFSRQVDLLDAEYQGVDVRQVLRNEVAAKKFRDKLI